MLTYQGKSEYCYACCTSMMLTRAGHQVSPSLVEVLTGVGLGATLFPDGNLLFSQVPPDTGINNALGRLRFTVSSGHGDDRAPWGRLSIILTESPVIIGPVDLAYLSYQQHRFERGTDHFLLAYGAENNHILLHDPGGFPHVRLDRDELDRAWRGDTIPYARASYQYWYDPLPSSTDERPLLDRALDGFRADYATMTSAEWVSGARAIELFADAATVKGLERLGRFTLPLAAARADHYAEFFAAHGRADLAEIKHAQARILGAAYCATAEGMHTELVGLLRRLAQSERRFVAALLEHRLSEAT